MGGNANWDHSKMPTERLSLPDPEALEAIRILGDARLGFGTMPAPLEKLLVYCKLEWLLEDKREGNSPWISSVPGGVDIEYL